MPYHDHLRELGLPAALAVVPENRRIYDDNLSVFTETWKSIQVGVLELSTWKSIQVGILELSPN